MKEGGCAPFRTRSARSPGALANRARPLSRTAVLGAHDRPARVVRCLPSPTTRPCRTRRELSCARRQRRARGSWAQSSRRERSAARAREPPPQASPCRGVPQSDTRLVEGMTCGEACRSFEAPPTGESRPTPRLARRPYTRRSRHSRTNGVYRPAPSRSCGSGRPRVEVPSYAWTLQATKRRPAEWMGSSFGFASTRRSPWRARPRDAAHATLRL